MIDAWAFAAGWTGALVALVFYVYVSASPAGTFVSLAGFYVVDRIKAERRTGRWTGTLTDADAEVGKS